MARAACLCHVLPICLLLPLAMVCGQEKDRPRTFSFVYYHDPLADAIDYRVGVYPKLKPGPEDKEAYDQYRKQYEAFQEELSWIKPDWVRVSMILNSQLMVGAVARPRLTAEEIREHLDKSAEKLKQLRERLPGVKFLHYLCQVKLSGDPEKHTGMFALYDHWDEYASLGLGPKPKRSMIDWVQRRGEKRALWRWANYEAHECPCYMLCPNAPETRQLRAAQVRLLAEAGVDGIFVDNPMMFCRCDICTELFRKRLAEKYTSEERKRFFGETDVARLDPVSDRYADSPLAVETLHFWTESCASLFRLYKETGEAVRGKGNFVVSTNGTPFEVEPNYCSNLSDWANYGLIDNAWRECRPVYLGRWDRATGGPLVEVGRADLIHAMLACRGVGREVYCSPGYNYSFVQLMPLYELAAAEHWAFEGLFLVTRSRAVYSGALQDPFDEGDMRQRILHDWFNGLRERLWQGARSAGRVAVLASHNEWFVGNAQFEAEFRVLTDLLGEAQIPFDILVDAGITSGALARYDLVICPCMTSLSSERHGFVRDFVQKGGRLLISGKYGTVNEVGCPREQPLVQEFVKATDAEARAEIGKGVVCYRPSPFVTIGCDPSCAVRTYDPPLYNRYGGKRHSHRLRLLADVARKPFLDSVSKMLDGRLSMVARADAPGLRSRLYAKGDALILHLVNYDVLSDWVEADIAYTPPKGTRPAVRRVWDVEATVPIPKGRRVQGVTLFRPGEEETKIADFRQLADGVAFTIPDLYIYGVAEIQLRDGQPDEALTLRDLCGGNAWTAQTDRPYRTAHFDLDVVPADAPHAPEKKGDGPLLQTCGYAFMRCRRGERVEGAVHTAVNASDERRLNLEHIAEAMDMGDSASRWSARGEWAQYWVIASTGTIILQKAVRCGESGKLEFEAETDGTYAVFVDAGTNFFRLDIPDRPAVLSAVRSHRMILQELQGRLYLRVPHGHKEIALQIHCSDKQGRIRIIAPDGVRLDREFGSGFHPMAQLTVPVKRDDWGTIWAIEVEKKSAILPMTFSFEEGLCGLMALSPGALLDPVDAGKE